MLAPSFCMGSALLVLEIVVNLIPVRDRLKGSLAHQGIHDLSKASLRQPRPDHSQVGRVDKPIGEIAAAIADGRKPPPKRFQSSVDEFRMRWRFRIQSDPRHRALRKGLAPT